MKFTDTTAAFYAASLVRLATAMQPPPDDGSIAACRSQGCDDCPGYASANEGYPNCIIYNSADNLGQSFATSDGTGYDVWWDSGAPNPSCQIVVRTPASTDIPECGYYLTSWSQAGCYYTNIQESFMLQYCCGSGDCDAASPAASMADAHSQALAGNTSIVSLKVENFAASGESGKRSIEGIGELSWKRSDHAYSKREEIAKDQIQQRDDGQCTFHPTSDRVSEGGQQVKASDSQVCNVAGGCAVAASVTVTESETINPSLTGNFFDVISAAVGYTFTKSTAYTSTDTYNQKQGTTGYLSYIPTLYCWDGTFSDCFEHNGDDITKIDPSTTFHACTPYIRSGGQLDGTFSFVYTN